mmetsp:Transcript_23041/g.59972  ORF Transcript_23041/g.59972 Transcript_23041/m.59972 type:complete len:294 (-) Transcript_23041:97-978(-)
MYLSSWLLAVEGSPTTATLISPRSLMPSGVVLFTPPINISSIAFFTSLAPYTPGARLCTRSAYSVLLAHMASISRRSSSLMLPRIPSTVVSSSPRMLTTPACRSACWTELARKQRRYVSSRTPSDLRPRMAFSPPLELLPWMACTRSPGVLITLASGTTIRLPLNTTLSPARACSTAWLRRITSMVRGRLPAGTSSVTSCTRTRCQSMKVLSSRTSDQWSRLPQVGLEQMQGTVNLNCCSTLRDTVLHSWQRKVPMNSSGRTSLVRVTVPVKDMSLPMSFTFRWRSVSKRVLL